MQNAAAVSVVKRKTNMIGVIIPEIQNPFNASIVYGVDKVCKMCIRDGMYSVTTLNSIMLGALGEIPMSASAIADQPFNIVSGIFRGLTLGGAILIAQYWGKGDTKAIRRVIAIGIRCSVLISLLTAILVIAFPAPIMGIFSTCLLYTSRCV